MQRHLYTKAVIKTDLDTGNTFQSLKTDLSA